MQNRNSKNIKVIDVSHHNGNIDWHKVASDGVQGVYIKLTEGTTFLDDQSYDNYIGAKNAGLRVGFYHYAHCTNDPKKEVEFFLKKLGEMKADLPHCLDLEENKGLSKTKVTSFALEWMNYLEQETGVTPILYTGYSFSKGNFTNAVSRFPLWVARYSGSNRSQGFKNPGDSSIWTKWAMFQFTDQGRVNGIKGNVDINEMDLDFFKMIDSGVTIIKDANPPKSYRKGDSGLGVKELQQKLEKLGYEMPKYGADGSFGEETELAVKQFQKDNNLTVDGIAGDKTLEALKDAKPKNKVENVIVKPVPVKKPTLLRPGTSGAEVRELQAKLNKFGFPAGRADGKYGSQTETAVRQFQNRVGLPVDGIFGPNTRTALDNYKPPGYPGLLKEGSRGESVKLVQKALGLKADGIFGPDTKRAIRNFQRKNGLGSDGLVGPRTWGKLF